MELPAIVVLSRGLLTVTADNSDLNQILGRIASMSGMTLNGLSTSARIYGVYGPGKPSEVLTSLLAGTGYNFLMLGRTADGAPRKLILMLKSASSPPSAGNPSAGNPAPEPSAAQNKSTAADEELPGPGAVVHVPPAYRENNNDQDTPIRVQRNLQRLEQMHKLQQKPDPQ
ncbi:MAG TPA: hypothetical protein VMU92_12575 [Acidobacteriaceae bacterium]|nr:hypothetical protein [Acidobacteriaceae bacterium]